MVLEAAANQSGLVTRSQLMGAGVSGRAIEHRLRSGLLRSLHAGVYQVGPVLAPHARELAALLACPCAAISHRTATGLWRLLPPEAPGDVVHLTLPPTGHRCRRPGIRAHRAVLPAGEQTRLDGLPLTTVARTLLDISDTVTARELERALARAERENLTGIGDLRSLLRRCPHRAGTRQLRLLLERGTASLLTRSVAEERLLGLVRTAGLPDPETNVVLHGIEVDCFWRRARLAVEVDGFAYHTSRRAFLRDRQRDSALAAAGIQVLRLSWHQVDRERDRTLVQLAQALVRARPAFASPQS